MLPMSISKYLPITFKKSSEALPPDSFRDTGYTLNQKVSSHDLMDLCNSFVTFVQYEKPLYIRWYLCSTH